jgi:hypothetical protein
LSECERREDLSRDVPAAIEFFNTTSHPFRGDFTHNMYEVVRKPRIWVGECSAMYRGYVACIIPRPAPPMSLAKSQ